MAGPVGTGSQDGSNSNNNNETSYDDDDNEDAYVAERNAAALASLGHSLVRLTRANIRRLLSTASALSLAQHRRDEAGAICARLAQLNPDVAALFRPKEEAVSRLALRMLLPSSAAAGSAEVPVEVDSFIAVSYCWHYPSWPLPAAASPIAPGWEISRPMVETVMRIADEGSKDKQGAEETEEKKKKKTEAVWLDRLCINQARDEDKTTHVGAMDLLYRSARRVVILLEDVQLADQPEAVAALTYKGFYQDMCDVVRDQGLEGAEKVAFVNGYFAQREKEWCAEQQQQQQQQQQGGDQDGGAGAVAGGTLGCSIKTVPQLQAAGKRFAVRVLRARWFSRAWCAHESRVSAHGKLNNPLFLCFGPSSSPSPSQSSGNMMAGGSDRNKEADNDNNNNKNTASSPVTPEQHDQKASTAEVLSFEFRFVHYFALHLCSLPQDPSPPSSSSSPSLPSPKLDKTAEELLDQQRLLDDPDPTALWQLWYRIQRLMPERSDACSAMQHLVSILSFGCLYRGDLISIALNTSGIPLVFLGASKVRSVGDAVWMFALLTLAAGDVVPLVMDGGKLRLERAWDGSSNSKNKNNENITNAAAAAAGPQGGQVISWSPHPKQAVLDEVLALRDPSHITHVASDYIELDLLLLTSLPAMPGPAALEKAQTMISRHGLDAMAEMYAAAAEAGVQEHLELIAAMMKRIKERSGRGGSGPLQVFVQLWLAIGIECGRAWVLRFPGSMARATAEGARLIHGVLGVEYDENLVPAARELMELFEGGGGAGGDSGDATGSVAKSQGDAGEDKSDGREVSDANNVGKGSTETDLDEPALRTATRFLRTILDPALKFLAAAPRLLPLGSHDDNEDKDFAVTCSSSNRAYIAIPLAVAHLPASHKRAWVLEPFDPARDPPETPADFLPDPARTGIAPGEPIEDVYPVLSSDYADRRRAWDGDGEGKKAGAAWRLRRREVVFGCRELDELVRNSSGGGGGGGGGSDGEVGGSSSTGPVRAVVLRRQRVYGAEDYDWGEIFKAAQRIEGSGPVEEGGGNEVVPAGPGVA
ncbi:HET domain-containing protein [Microdochium nivale]|nr:HET domain-containing protein [Microdochium nivale]